LENISDLDKGMVLFFFSSVHKVFPVFLQMQACKKYFVLDTTTLHALCILPAPHVAMLCLFFYCMPILYKMGTFPDFFVRGFGFIKIYKIRISRLKKDPEPLSLKQRVTSKKQ